MSRTREELLQLHSIRLALKEAGYHVCRVEKELVWGGITIHAIGYSPEPTDRILEEEAKELGLVE